MRGYASVTHNEATKNHPGGIEDSRSTEKETRMYSKSDDPHFDGLNCLKIYLKKLNPKCEALFQYPKRYFLPEEQVWYEKKPCACLLRIYSNHCVQATAITLWSDVQVPSWHVMVISGHHSEASLKSYNAPASSDQLKACSDVLPVL